MKYLQWNHAIGEFFFNPNEAGNEVFLYITQKEIAENVNYVRRTILSARMLKLKRKLTRR